MPKENYEYLNLMARQVVETLNNWLNPIDVVINQPLEVNEHLTISTLIPQELRKRIWPFAQEMKRIEPSLILNDSSLYHFTTYWSPINVDVNSLKTEVEAQIKREPLVFSVNGFLFGVIGISLKLYPTNNALVDLRQKLSAIAGTNFKLDERNVTSWINLARYKQPPKIELKKYIQAHSDQDFGIYTPTSIGFYRSKNKNFIGAVELFSVNNS